MYDLREHRQYNYPIYCDTRDLPSFPTRRSSDLTRETTAQPFQAATTLSSRAGRGRWARAARRRSRTPANQAASSGSASRRDRKSTRLNSSHVKISYAVFCLKKKKQTKKQIIC